jgi:hypothetical protein
LYQSDFSPPKSVPLKKNPRNSEESCDLTGSRSGKFLPPKFGLLSVVTDLYLQANIHDIALVPIREGGTNDEFKLRMPILIMKSTCIDTKNLISCRGNFSDGTVG